MERQGRGDGNEVLFVKDDGLDAGLAAARHGTVPAAVLEHALADGAAVQAEMNDEAVDTRPFWRRLRLPPRWLEHVAVFKAALRIALLGRPEICRLRFRLVQFWLSAAGAALLSMFWSYLAAPPPRHFNPQALQTEAYGDLWMIAIGALAARLLHRPHVLWPVAILLLTANWLSGSVLSWVYDYLLPRWADGDRGLYVLAFVLWLSWFAAIIYRSVTSLVPQASKTRLMAATLLPLPLITALAFATWPQRFWVQDVYAAYRADAAQHGVPLDAETVFSRQPQLLAQALAALAPGEAGHSHLYFVGVAPDGDQAVFSHEVDYAGRLFEKRFGATQRVLTLSNNRMDLSHQPLATATNLEQALASIGARMNVDDDILFLFLTSHGSREAELSVSLEDLSFRPLNAAALAQMLARSGIRWKVIVVSACYSGSFIPALRDPHTLLITASRADRSSFGCSNSADFTYFGRAYFEQALSQTDSFTSAFERARTLVSRWEAEGHYPPSEPQIVSSPLIEAQLLRWHAQQSAAGAAVDRAAPTVPTVPMPMPMPVAGKGGPPASLPH